jgi:hypothetical protein
MENAERRPGKDTALQNPTISVTSVPPGAVTLAAARPIHPAAASFDLQDLPDDLSASITIAPGTGEWMWTGRLDRDGYGRHKGQGAHRVVYTLLVGPIPPGFEIDHVRARGCTSRACVSPWCLEAVPPIVNILRGTSFAAINAAKTECDHGHDFDLLNTYYRPDGHRDCRACGRDRVKRYKQRKRRGLTSRRPDVAGQLGRLGQAA